jgi:chromatin modification-related protein VID21
VPLTPAQHQILLQQAAAQAQANQVNQGVQGGQGQGNPANRAGAQGNVGIARISTPSAPPGVGGTRLTSQQIMQLQAVQQQQRSLSQQMANGAVNGTGVNGNTAGNAVNRDPTASPAQHGLNSPHLAGSLPANSPSPVPGVAQAGSQGQQATRTGNHYLNTTQYTPEQLQAVRLQMMVSGYFLMLRRPLTVRRSTSSSSKPRDCSRRLPRARRARVDSLVELNRVIDAAKKGLRFPWVGEFPDWAASATPTATDFEVWDVCCAPCLLPLPPPWPVTASHQPTLRMTPFL